MKRIHALLAALIGLIALPASAASRIVPAEPSAFDPVNLRMTVDSCTFVPATVRGAATGSVFPPAPRPLADYTGLWWNADESGWGVSLHQSPAHVVFGAWFIYDSAGQPEWYTLQGGRCPRLRPAPRPRPAGGHRDTGVPPGAGLRGQRPLHRTA